MLLALLLLMMLSSPKMEPCSRAPLGGVVAVPDVAEAVHGNADAGPEIQPVNIPHPIPEDGQLFLQPEVQIVLGSIDQEDRPLHGVEQDQASALVRAQGFEHFLFQDALHGELLVHGKPPVIGAENRRADVRRGAVDAKILQIARQSSSAG